MLERHWELADGKKRWRRIIPCSKVKEVLAEMHGGTSGEHLWSNRAIDKVGQVYYWLRLRGDVEGWCQE